MIQKHDKAKVFVLKINEYQRLARGFIESYEPEFRPLPMTNHILELSNGIQNDCVRMKWLETNILICFESCDTSIGKPIDRKSVSCDDKISY